MRNQPKIVFISWQPYCSRSDAIAKEFNGKSYMVYYEFLGSNYFTIWIKYILQIIKSLFILLRENPDIIFVMSPPIFACIPVWIYSKIIAESDYIIDAHSGSLLNPMWKNVMFLHKIFSKHAIVTIVTNDYLSRIIKQWPANSFIVRDIPIKTNKIKINKLQGEFNITLVNTFASDEPLDNFIKAVSEIKEARFHITGKLTKKCTRFLNNATPNITFTDFLPENDYFGLLKASNIVIALTTKDHIMQRGAYEAIYMGKPVITSDWKILKENFYKGAIFVDNTVEGIRSGIYTALEKIDMLQKDAAQLRNEKLKLWEIKKNELLHIIKRSR
jgi:glycosyltransferase involved in cell wall biosynthesis